MRPATLCLDNLTLEGFSRAGDASWFRVHPPGLAFDTGRGALQLAGSRDVFLTHGHLDHALGVPFVLSQRSLHRTQETRLFCPREIAGDLDAFVVAAARLERVRYDYEIVPLAAGDRVTVGRGLAVEAFPVDHVVPSLGYHLVRAKRHLAPALRERTAEELAALREQGVETTVVEDDYLLSYCGDTGPGVFDLAPQVFASRVLLLECTFLGPALRDKGSRFKHLHLADLAARAADFANEDLVLVHLSRRHREGDLVRAVAEQLPGLTPRVHVLLEASDTPGEPS